MAKGFRSLSTPPVKIVNDPHLAGWFKDLVTVIGTIQQGKLNSLAEVTLTASSATTTLDDPRIGAESYIRFMGLTANARAIAEPQVTSQGVGTAALSHANNANADKTFRVLIVG